MVLTHPFHSPTQVVEGHAYNAAVADLLGNRCWALITSRGWMERDAARDLTRYAPQPAAILSDVLPNPKIFTIIEMAQNLPDVDAIVALGGGSVLDAAKGIIALKALGGDSKAFMAHLSENIPLPSSMVPVPLIAVPTTSGTGSEVTRWGTLWGDDEVKHSVNDAKLYPAYAVLDPNLCTSMSLELTLGTALDSLSHALEAIWNKRHSAVTDELAGLAISLIRKYLSPTLKNPTNLELRRNMQSAALIAGMAMGTTQTALAHSISYPFTAKLGLPHGFACAFTLAEVARYNMVTNADRLVPAASALGCPLELLPDTLESWMSEFGVGKILDRFISTSFIEGLNSHLITRARAANNIRDVDGIAAKQLALNAYRQLSPTQSLNSALSG